MKPTSRTHVQHLQILLQMTSQFSSGSLRILSVYNKSKYFKHVMLFLKSKYFHQRKKNMQYERVLSRYLYWTNDRVSVYILWVWCQWTGVQWAIELENVTMDDDDKAPLLSEKQNWNLKKIPGNSFCLWYNDAFPKLKVDAAFQQSSACVDAHPVSCCNKVSFLHIKNKDYYIKYAS